MNAPSTRIGAPPRLGFVGTGWIGRLRMEAAVRSGLAHIAAVADPVSEAAAAAAALAPGAAITGSLEEVLDLGVDGVVIATPSAVHAAQVTTALDRGVAVFCQKPLGRTAAESRHVIDAARRADRLLGVDFSYRFTDGMRKIRALIDAGELGRIYAATLVFHNAYGPDRPWFYDPTLSGGGCVMDLGIHLVDLALWALGGPVSDVSSRLLAHGERLADRPTVVEDYAVARLDLADGTVVEIACSWGLPAGCEAVIGASFYGTHGGAGFHNVGGSFYDFVAERYRGTARETLSTPPDDWGGRALIEWTRRLAARERYDPAVEGVMAVADALDRIYGRTDSSLASDPSHLGPAGRR